MTQLVKPTARGHHPVFLKHVIVFLRVIIRDNPEMPDSVNDRDSSSAAGATERLLRGGYDDTLSSFGELQHVERLMHTRAYDL